MDVSWRRTNNARLSSVLLFLLIALVLVAPRRAAAFGNISTFTVSPSTLTFPSANPSTPSISATENPITVTLQSVGSSNWSITVTAAGDLTSGGGATIPISNITWTSVSANFNSTGTLSKSSSATVAVGSGNPNISGTLRFYLANSWSFPTGTFTQTITFTAIAL